MCLCVYVCVCVCVCVHMSVSMSVSDCVGVTACESVSGLACEYVSVCV